MVDDKAKEIADEIAHRLANELAGISDERLRAKVVAAVLVELTSMMMRMLR